MKKLFQKNVGNNVQKIRMFKKLTQIGLAEKAGLSIKTVWNVENVASAKSRNMTTYKKLAKALGVNVNELINK